MGEVMANSGGEQLSALDQLVDQLIIQTVCENNADFMPSASSQDSESDHESSPKQMHSGNARRLKGR